MCQNFRCSFINQPHLSNYYLDISNSPGCLFRLERKIHTTSLSYLFYPIILYPYPETSCTSTWERERERPIRSTAPFQCHGHRSSNYLPRMKSLVYVALISRTEKAFDAERRYGSNSEYSAGSSPRTRFTLRYTPLSTQISQSYPSRRFTTGSTVME